MISTEQAEEGAAAGAGAGAAASAGSHHRHTWAEDASLGCQGRPQPGGEDEEVGLPGEEGPETACCGEACGGGVEDDAGPFSGDGGGEDEEGQEAEGEEGAARKAPVMHSNCSSDTCIPTPSCRICFQGAEQGDLLNPCRCDGSVRYTHQHCLLKWISERGSWTCELCCYRFHVIAINMKRPWQWQSITITLVEKVQIIAVFLGSLFLVASISWLLWSAFSPQAVWQRRDVLFQICYGMYGFMDLVCIGLIVHEGAAVYNVFMRWRAVNLHWDVQSYDKAKDMEEHSVGPRTLWLPLVTFGPSGSSQATQLGPQPWTCFSLAPFCPSVGTRDNLHQDSDSGEVVIRVTSV